MAVRCGSCHKSHPHVADVRACYEDMAQEQAQARAEVEAERAAERFYEEGTEAQHAQYQWEVQRDRDDHPDDPQGGDLLDGLQQMVREKQWREDEEEQRAAAVLDQMTGAPGRDMASDKQVNYALDLLRIHEWPDEFSREDLVNMERRQVSKLINGLLASPRKQIVKDLYDNVPDGRYALEWHIHRQERDSSGRTVNADIATGWVETKLRFLEVSRSDKPQGAGRVFLSELFGAPGSFRKQPIRGKAADDILKTIAEDPDAAMSLFGKETRTCGRCHSPLTDANSRRRGIGPICLGKMGWAS